MVGMFFYMLFYFYFGVKAYKFVVKNAFYMFTCGYYAGNSGKRHISEVVKLGFICKMIKMYTENMSVYSALFNSSAV